MTDSSDIGVLLLTSNGLRHRYAAARVAAGMRLVGVLSESKPPMVSKPETLSAEDRAVIDRHFAERQQSEERWLSTIPGWPDCPLLEIEHGQANQPEVHEWACAQSPDVVVLYGTSIIKPPLLTAFGDRMINVHLGLSPYYRGSGTNFWPLVDNLPECVGATIHLAVAKVDAGPILAQVRPPMEASDRAHDLGTKTLIATLDALPRVIGGYLAGELTPRPQLLDRGRQIRRKEFCAEAVLRLWQNLEQGMIAAYLSEGESRRQQYPVVEPPPPEDPESV